VERTAHSHMSAEGKQAFNNGYPAARPVVMLKTKPKQPSHHHVFSTPRLLFLSNYDIWHWVTATKLGSLQTYPLKREIGIFEYCHQSLCLLVLLSNTNGS
jgi:hypothetical protein